jgi:hypothetical protein
MQAARPSENLLGRWFHFVMAVVASAIAAAPALAAHSGGGYIVIMRPGSPGMTPRKDQICVAENLNVGQSFKNANGDLLTVKSLSGKSPMCKKPAIPILAQVEFNASATWQSTLSIELPEGYTQLDLTEKERFDGARLHAVNKSKDVSVYVQSWDRRKTVQLFDLYVDDEKRNWATRGVKTKQTETEKFTIHGAKAQRWETEIPGSSLFAPGFTHLTTDLLGQSEVVYIDVMTQTKRFPALREEIRKIGESLVGLVKEDPAPAPAEVAAPVGTT